MILASPAPAAADSAAAPAGAMVETNPHPAMRFVMLTAEKKYILSGLRRVAHSENFGVKRKPSRWNRPPAGSPTAIDPIPSTILDPFARQRNDRKLQSSTAAPRSCATSAASTLRIMYQTARRLNNAPGVIA